MTSEVIGPHVFPTINLGILKLLCHFVRDCIPVGNTADVLTESVVKLDHCDDDLPHVFSDSWCCLVLKELFFLELTFFPLLEVNLTFTHS